MVDLELDQLKREFLAEAEEKAREMEAKIGEPSPEALERLSYLAHQLKGSGGSYGFERISAEAAEVESAVEHLADVEEDREVVREHIEKLKSEIDRRSAELAAR